MFDRMLQVFFLSHTHSQTKKQIIELQRRGREGDRCIFHIHSYGKGDLLCLFRKRYAKSVTMNGNPMFNGMPLIWSSVCGNALSRNASREKKCPCFGKWHTHSQKKNAHTHFDDSEKAAHTHVQYTNEESFSVIF